MTKGVQSHLYDCVSFLPLTHMHTNLYRYFSSAAVIRMQQMLSIDACQSLILSSPTFNLPSCCATNPVSCHFLRSSDCSLKAPSPPDKEEGNHHCLLLIYQCWPPFSLQPQIKGLSCPRAPLITGLVSLCKWTPGLLHFHPQIGFQ